jgi:hypothetical protein
MLQNIIYLIRNVQAGIFESPILMDYHPSGTWVPDHGPSISMGTKVDVVVMPTSGYTSGIPVWSNNRFTGYTTYSAIPTSTTNATHPSTAFTTDGYYYENFGIVWQQGKHIRYTKFNYDLNEDSFWYDAVEYLTAGNISSEDCNPAISFSFGIPVVAWEGFVEEPTPAYGIITRDRSNGVWGPHTIFIGSTDIFSPSIAGDIDRPRYVIGWHDGNSTMQLAKYNDLNGWLPFVTLSVNGMYPSVAEDCNYGGTHRLAFTTGSAPVRSLSTSNEGLENGIQKELHSGLGGYRKIASSSGDTIASIMMKATIVNDGREHELEFVECYDSTRGSIEAGLPSFLKFRPITIRSGMKLRLEVVNPTQHAGKMSKNIPIELIIEEAGHNSTLCTFELNTTPSNGTNRYTLDLNTIAGKTINIIPLPIGGYTSSQLWNTAIVFLDTTSRRSSQKEISEKAIDLEIPQAWALSQNYPNPFNPATTIQYSLKSPSSVTVEIFDVLGRKVATLVNEQKPAGMYTVRWDATRASSGLYFYKINVVGESGRLEYQQTRKMLLTK